MVRNAQLAQATQGASRQTQPLVAWHVGMSVWLQLLMPLSSGPQGLVHDVEFVPAGQLAWFVSPAGHMVELASRAGPSPVSLTVQAPTKAAIANEANLILPATLEIFICSPPPPRLAQISALFWVRPLLVLATQHPAQGRPRFCDHLGLSQAVDLAAAVPHAARSVTIGETHAAGQRRAGLVLGLA